MRAASDIAAGTVGMRSENSQIDHLFVGQRLKKRIDGRGCDPVTADELTDAWGAVVSRRQGPEQSTRRTRLRAPNHPPDRFQIGRCGVTPDCSFACRSVAGPTTNSWLLLSGLSAVIRTMAQPRSAAGRSLPELVGRPISTGGSGRGLRCQNAPRRDGRARSPLRWHALSRTAYRSTAEPGEILRQSTGPDRRPRPRHQPGHLQPRARPEPDP
jgi:hypothetical protein